MDRHETSAGGVIVRRVQGHYDVCLVLRERHGRAWSLPKGHVEAGEDPPAAAVREVREETGLVGDILAPLGTISYEFRALPRKGRCLKTVFFFLMRATGGRLGPQDTETLEARWLALEEAIAIATYDNERRVLEEAKRQLARPEVMNRVPDDPPT